MNSNNNCLNVKIKNDYQDFRSEVGVWQFCARVSHLATSLKIATVLNRQYDNPDIDKTKKIHKVVEKPRVEINNFKNAPAFQIFRSTAEWRTKFYPRESEC